MWSPTLSQGFETDKIKYLTVPYTQGVGLDIGCGPKRIWPQTIGIDRYISPDGASVSMDVMKLPIFADRSFDYVYSSHVVEDFDASDSVKLLSEWWRVLKVGGHLVLYLPHDELYPKVGEPGANPAHKQNLNPETVIGYMKQVGGWMLVENEVRGSGNEYSFFMVFTKRSDRQHLTRLRTTPKNSALVIRYGGFGDMLQASSVIATLADQGYEVFVNTTPKGKEVLRFDPNISGWWMQEQDQVPNNQLTDYWRALGERFDKVVNLSESVEGQFLVIPGRPESNFPAEVLREKNGGNYMDYAHDLAGIPRGSRLKFYPSGEERKWAEKQKRKIGGKVVLWSLSGSSVHKAYPWTDNVIATLLVEDPDVQIVMVGDTLCQILEDGWRDEKRVHRRSGVWSIRETLAFAQVADVVVGPETGVLNAVSMEKNHKVLMLSHSTVENLSRDWVNTTNIVPEVDCYPCHRLHYSFEYCRKDEETHGAACATSIRPEYVADCVLRVLGERVAA